MDITKAKALFEDILDKTDSESTKANFLKWLKHKLMKGFWDDIIHYKTNEDKILDCIRDEIRELLPLSAISDGEHISFPKVGPNADCDPKTTIHVDAFLYDDEEIDELEDEGKLTRNYCVNCHSQDIQPLEFISHSISINQIKYIFEYILPDLRNKTILDVGSRTGALLYGAFLYSSCCKIFGVEIDKTFFDIQQKFVKKYNMSERIQVFNDDIINKGDMLKAADVVIMNNVFEFFMDKSAQEKYWNYIRNIYNRKGCILITIPSLPESLQYLQTDIVVECWVSSINDKQKYNLANEYLYGDNLEESDLDQVYIYEVIG